MTKLNRTQLRSLIREAIDDVQSEKNAALLKKKVQIRIIERKLSNFSETLNAVSELSLVNEGLFDNIRGGLGVMASTLGKAAFGDWAGGKGYEGDPDAGLKRTDLEKIGKSMPMKNLNSAIKSVPPALKRLENTKISDIVSGQGIIALDAYISSVSNVFENLAKISELTKKDPASIESVDRDVYNALLDKANQIYEKAVKMIESLQDDLQNAAINLTDAESIALQLNRENV